MSTTLAAPGAAAEEAPAKGGRTRRIGIVVLLVAALAGAGWLFVLKPADSAPKPGDVVALESIQVNLAGGHYLRLGMALQLTKGSKEADGSKALDAAIGVFSGLPVGEVNKPTVRETLRKQLEKRLAERYHGEVMEVYFTEFVTQ